MRTGVFTYQPNKMTGLLLLQTRSQDVRMLKIIIDKDRWSLTNGESFLEFDDNSEKLILEGNTLPRLHSDGFCKPLLNHPQTIV